MTLGALDRLVTKQRVRLVCIILAIGYGIAAALWFALLRGDLDLRGQPLGADFIIFYGASSLALKGKAILAYSAHAILKAERGAVAGSQGIYLWCYPPAFQLLIAPLALLPYRTAFAVFSLAGFGLYLGMTRLIGWGREALLLAVAFPAVFQNFMQGQNGFLTCAILGAGLLLMDRRPWTAGAILGLLVIKPHLAILLPVLTLGTGRWKSIGGAAVSSLAVIGVSLLAFGVEPWRAFFTTLPMVGHELAAGLLPLNKTPTLFVALIQLGVPLALAQGVQALAAVTVMGATLIAWRKAAPWPLKAGLAALGTLIALPYAFDYDLMLLAVPVGSRVSLALLYAAPLLVVPLWAIGHVQLAPLILIAGYVGLWRQLIAAGRGVATTPALSLQPA